MTLTEEQYARAPKYVRRELSRLNMRLSEAQRALKAGTNADTPYPRIEVDPYNDYPILYPADRHRIRFQFSERFDHYLDLRKNSGDEVEVHSGRSLSIRPNASNVARLIWERDY